MNTEEILKQVSEVAVNAGGKLLGAILIWIVGRWLISLAKTLLAKSLRARKIDDTVSRYVQSAIGVLLNITLIVAILGFFGVETTTFAAVLAAGGVAIGIAWSGLLANMAAGTVMVVLRPFKVGDFVSAGGTTGTVDEIGLFTTVLNTPDNVRTIVGNSKVIGDTIQNFSANPFRRVDLVAQLDHNVDHKQAIDLLSKRVAKIDNVLKAPAPVVEIVEFTLAGPVLGVRPFTHPDNYWQVYFDTNKAIREEFGNAGFPAPQTHYALNKVA
jgi:small conductance mechanosensitive channel